MRTVIVRRGFAMLAVVALSLSITAGPAFAHAQGGVGDLVMVVGFGTEPAYVDQPNSVQLILTHDGEPVTDLGDTLKVEVSFEDQTTELPLEPYFEVGEFGTPGDYRAWFVPSQPGKYTFHFSGTIDGEKVDESFTSGPKTFSEVEALASATFPQVTAPSNQELADRIDTEATRSTDAVAAANAAAASAEDAASSAKTIGIIALILGVIGTIAGIAGLAAARRKTA